MRLSFATLATLVGILGCGSSDGSDHLFNGTGSATASGGAASSGGGANNGGSSPGGASSGGMNGSGGVGVGGASGGSSSSGGASSSGGGGTTSSGGTSANGGTSSSGGSSSGGAGTGGACTSSTVWCHDQDGDQHGDPAQTQTGCPSPGSDWVTVCDDCDDAKQLVHPGAACQATYYTAADGVTLSFDYDCGGTETECGAFTKAAASCTTAGIGVCAGEGYLPNPSRTTTAGQNAYCGSTSYRNCVAVGVPCVAQAVTMTAIPCQ